MRDYAKHCQMLKQTNEYNRKVDLKTSENVVEKRIGLGSLQRKQIIHTRHSYGNKLVTNLYVNFLMLTHKFDKDYMLSCTAAIPIIESSGKVLFVCLFA
jgi:hypothetical protein